MARKLGAGLFRGARSWRSRDGRRQPRSDRSRRSDLSDPRARTPCDGVDLEAGPLTRRRLHPEALHSMSPAEDGKGVYSSPPEQASSARSADDLLRVSSLLSTDVALLRESEELIKEHIQNERDKYWENARHAVKEETGCLDTFDEEEVLQKYAKDELLKTVSNAHLMMTAEVLIDEDWLGTCDAFPGNIYRLAVMGDIFEKLGVASRSMGERAQDTARIVGIMIIVAIQVCGPPMIFGSRVFGVGVLNQSAYRWECCPWHWSFDRDGGYTCVYDDTPVEHVSSFDDWHHVITTKCLGMLMIAAFILNGIFVISDEKQSWFKIYSTFRYLDVKNDKFSLSGRGFLIMDAAVNTWVIFWCCIDVFLVIGPSANPTEVLMNALGLVFLYNLDDIGGDLGFVNEDDWPGDRLCWIHDNIVAKDSSFDPHKVQWEATTCFKLGEGVRGWLGVMAYNLMIAMGVVMAIGLPFLAVFTPFVQIADF